MALLELSKERMQNVGFQCTPFGINQENTETSFIPHYHAYHQLTVIKQGTAELVLNNTAYPVCAGNAYVITSYLPHYLRNAKNLQVSNLVFYLDDLDRCVNSLRFDPNYCSLFYLQPSRTTPDRPSNVLFLNHETFREVEHIIDLMLHEIEKDLPGRDIITQAYFLILITLLSREVSNSLPSEKVEPGFVRLINHIEDSYDSHITVESMVSIAGLPEKRLRALFHTHYSMTPMEYLQSIRLKKAKYLLLSSSMNISEISAAIGFNDSNYFSRVFQDAFHTSPREYRKGNGY